MANEENARKEMEALVADSMKGYREKPDVFFAKLSEVTKAIASGAITWARKNSSWPMLFGTACCALELMDFGSARIDAERNGILLFRGTPRQCDVMIVAGWLTKSMIPEVKRLYEQMAKPRYVIAFGECATCGGPWWQSYNIIRGMDQVLPVDVYVAGCPPKPENLLDAFLKLQEKIGGKLGD